MIDYKEALYIIIGNRIKTKREDVKISQDILSKELNISRSSVSNIEVGRHQVPLLLLYEICKVLELDIKKVIPSQNEILQYSNSDISDYSNYLNSLSIQDDLKEKISDVIKNI